MLSCLAIASSLAIGEVKISVVPGTPSDPDPHAKLVIIVQTDPGDPDPHPQRTFELNDPLLSPDPFLSQSPSPIGPVILSSPPHYATSETEPLRLWSPLLLSDPVSPVFLNPLGDQNGDGPPDIGMSIVGAANPPTIVWARQVGRGNHDPVFARFVDGAWTEWTSIASDPAEDLDPLWLEAPDATIHAVWRRIDPTTGNSQIRYATRTAEDTPFAADEAVSVAGEESAAPSLALLPTGEPLIAYATTGSDGARGIVVASKASPDVSFQHEVVGVTSFTSPNPEIRSRCGRTWLVWTESSAGIATTELVDGLWSSPVHVSHDAAVSDGKARMSLQAELCRGR
jgi:hypothetical protein